jgi:hypothetical protein
MITATQSNHPKNSVYKSTPPTAVDFDALELLSIFAHYQQITVVERPNNQKITQYLQQTADALGRGFQLTLKASESVSKKVLTQRLLPDQLGRDTLLADLDLLAHLYSDLIGCPEIGVRLEVLHGAMCPTLHVDRTGIRLLCTYLGPGAEWLDDRYADRSKLGISTLNVCDADSGLILDSAGLHQAPTFAIALLKGSLWQGNQQRGVIHRSPSVNPEQIRVLVAMDALW